MIPVDLDFLLPSHTVSSLLQGESPDQIQLHHNLNVNCMLHIRQRKVSSQTVKAVDSMLGLEELMLGLFQEHGCAESKLEDISCFSLNMCNLLDG